MAETTKLIRNHKEKKLFSEKEFNIVSKQAQQLCARFLVDKDKRISLEEALNDPFFRDHTNPHFIRDLPQLHEITENLKH